MLEKFLEDYIDSFYSNQNINMQLEQRNLYTKQQYFELLRPVIEVLYKHKDYSIEEIRNILYINSGIEDKVRTFVNKREMVPGLIFSYGTDSYRETVIIGNKQEVALDSNNNLIPSIERMTEDTIFDLASVTKLFTSLSILKLLQQDLIKLDHDVTRYAPQFKNLNGIKIIDLLSFNVPLKTNARVDGTGSKEESEKILFQIEVDNSNNNYRPYTDMGAMVLKYVIEGASGLDYYDFVNNNILKPLQLVDTHVVIPKYKLDRVASTNLDFKYYKDGTFSTNKSALKGVSYDPKAQAMGQIDGNLSGHAGLFSTTDDMTKLAKGIIGGQIIDDNYVEEMAKNRTGKAYVENDKTKYVQYLGYLCYSKNPILGDSELFHAMSGRSIASAGWTGTQLTVDPINNIFLFMSGNRSHNRMTYIDPIHKDKIIENDNGKRTIVLPDGNIRIDSTRFAWDRDEVVVHPALKLAIQYKMLEDIYKLSNEKIEISEKSIVI